MSKLFKRGSLILSIGIAALAVVGINYAGMNDAAANRQEGTRDPEPAETPQAVSGETHPAWDELFPDSWKTGRIAYDYTISYKGEQGEGERISGRLIHGKNMFMDSSSRQIHYRYGEVLLTLDMEEKTAYWMQTSDKGTAFAMSDMGSLFQSVNDSLYAIETIHEQSAGKSVIIISARSQTAPVRDIRIAYVTREREKSVQSIELSFNPAGIGGSGDAQMTLMLENIVSADEVPAPYLPEVQVSAGQVVLTGKFKEYKLLKG
ncbi:MAG: hypothetical protein KL787_05640 [Taibaiella sp.]|nr:hypothetical protein [Taibaiella sp.]